MTRLDQSPHARKMILGCIFGVGNVVEKKGYLSMPPSGK